MTHGLPIVGTAAMCLVGGGLLRHGLSGMPLLAGPFVHANATATAVPYMMDGRADVAAGALLPGLAGLVKRLRDQAFRPLAGFPSRLPLAKAWSWDGEVAISRKISLLKQIRSGCFRLRRRRTPRA